MFSNLFKPKERNLNLISIDKKLKIAFSNIKREFDEHLEAINESTQEIQSNYETLLKIESRMDKIESKLNEIDMFVRQFKTQNVYFIDDETNTFTIEPLNEQEKSVFKAIYEMEAEGLKVTYSKLADLLGVSTSLVRDYTLALIEKGIPIMKNYLDHNVFLSLEPKFRELQTKKNIISL